jgi:CDP-diacylglycerol---glycerol-3-phosphate 3-phosphatidyltransferase
VTKRSWKIWWKMANRRRSRKMQWKKTRIEKILVQCKQTFPWVTANRITAIRIPFALIAFACFPDFFWLALSFYAISASLDGLDGAWARANEEETEIGKIADPLIDKMSVLLLLLMFAVHGLLNVYIVGIMVCLEFLSTSVYAYSSYLGNTQGANRWGKYKKWVQDICILSTLIVFLCEIPIPVNPLLGIACALSALSSLGRWRDTKKELSHTTTQSIQQQ